MQDFLRVTGADPAKLDVLLQIATVHSGRRGLAEEHVPELLWQVLGGSGGLSERWSSPSSGVHFALLQFDDKLSMPHYLGLITTTGDLGIIQAR